MKRLITLLLIVVVFATVAMAESLVNEGYTDVPTAMTQDSVVEILASEECVIEALQPDEESIALLDDVYTFVWEEGNRPARYYDEETQQEISELAGGIDIDILHMTEAMRLQLTGEPENAVESIMRLDVDYHVGQLIIVVMGIPQEDGSYEWYPYRGRVETVGEIIWDIPVEDWNKLCLQPVSFHVLTDRIGARGERIWHYEEEQEHYEIFSKDSGDVINVHEWYTENGEIIEDDFRVWMVDLTYHMQEEVLRIGEFLAEGNLLMDWFPVERKNEAQLMMPEGTDMDALVAYDIIALEDENYKDTYGDVNVKITFATAYSTDKAMIVLAGFPIENAEEEPYFEWYVLRAEAIVPVEGAESSYEVEIGLKQLILPRMEEEPMMLVVISEDLEPEVEEQEEMQE